MQPGDARLESESPAARQGECCEVESSANGVAVPPGAIDFLKGHDMPQHVRAGWGSGIRQQQQREKPGHLAIIRFEAAERPREFDGGDGDRPLVNVLPLEGGVPHRIQEVNGSQHVVHPAGPLRLVGGRQADALPLELPLRPGEPCAHRSVRNEHRIGDF